LCATLAIVPALSDDADADALPHLDVYRISDGQPVRDGIIRDISIEYDVCSDVNGTVYSVREGAVLHGGESYLHVSGDHPGPFSLRCNPYTEDEVLRSTGLCVKLYLDPSCTGEPDFASPVRFGEDTLVCSGLMPWTRYHLVVETLFTRSFETPREDFLGVALNFSVTTDYRYNALTLDPNWGDLGTIDTRLLRNGERYSFPVPEREDFVFTGWYTDPQYGENVPNGSIIYLEQDATYYAHWWPRGSHHIEIETPSGCLVEIEEVAEGTATLAIESHSPDGTVWVSFPETNVSVVTMPVVVHLDTSSQKGILTLTGSVLAREQYEAIQGWLLEKGLLVSGTYLVPVGRTVIVEPSVLEELSSTDAVLELPFDAATLFLDTVLMDSLAGLEDDLSITASETSSSSLTMEQKRAIARNRSVDISMSCGDVPIAGFDRALRIRMSADTNDVTEFHVYHVTRDGGKVDMGAVLGDGWVEFSTDHLSVFCLEVHHPEPDRTGTVLMVVVAVAMMLLLPNILKMSRRR
ncbi:MAG: InlB B-repeat-containing protein, partial [archaeon]|nr:InlB B-repeat-containing protein [archaeon]